MLGHFIIRMAQLIVLSGFMIFGVLLIHELTKDDPPKTPIQHAQIQK